MRSADALSGSLDPWLYPKSLCADRVPHPPHLWGDELDADDRAWCRGRIPFTVEAARAGAELVTTLRVADEWREMCQRTSAGNRFLCSREWVTRYAELRAADELSRSAARLRPWWRRLCERWR